MSRILGRKTPMLALVVGFFALLALKLIGVSVNMEHWSVLLCCGILLSVQGFLSVILAEVDADEHKSFVSDFHKRFPGVFVAGSHAGFYVLAGLFFMLLGAGFVVVGVKKLVNWQ